MESTLDSVSKALDDAGKKPSELDAILLVGGSTRTPLVSRLLRERTGLDPRQDVHPDLGVALGAGVLASRLAGRDVERVLVDVSPYSFGPSYLGERGGVPYPHCYHPLIRRNTPLPVTRTESYYTSLPGQTRVDIQIFQGDDEDALNNVLVGDFHVEGLTRTDGMNEVLCRMSLDVDGILHVSAIEKRTGKSKQITIAGALQAKSDAEIAAAPKAHRGTVHHAPGGFSEVQDVDEDGESEEDNVTVIEPDAKPVDAQRTNGKTIPMGDEWTKLRHEAVDLIERSRALASTDACGRSAGSGGLAESIEGRWHTMIRKRWAKPCVRLRSCCSSWRAPDVSGLPRAFSWRQCMFPVRGGSYGGDEAGGFGLAHASGCAARACRRRICA